MYVTIVRLIRKVKLKPTILSNFQGRTAHLLWFSITITLIKVNGAHFPPDADSITSVGDAEANTKLPTVSTTNQLYQFRARPKSNQIELLNIPKITQIIIFFFNACRYARFHISICWPKITQVLKKILIQDKKYLVAKILFSRVAGPFLHPSFPTVSPFGFVLKKDDDFRLIPYLFLSSNIYRIRKHRLSIYVASKNKKIKLNAYA